MRLRAATLSALIFAIATSAEAQPFRTAPTMADARCLLAMVALSNSSDPSQQHLGEGGVIYFTGRLAAQNPKFDFASLRSLAATMDARSAQTDLQRRCGPMLEKSMQQLQTALPPASASPASAGRRSPPPR